MNIDNAIDILGINRTRKGDLQPMIKALSCHSWLNTEEDQARLEAAKCIIRNWRAYSDACDTSRDRKFWGSK